VKVEFVKIEHPEYPGNNLSESNKVVRNLGTLHNIVRRCFAIETSRKLHMYVMYVVCTSTSAQLRLEREGVPLPWKEEASV
jgi:hypothetical protein